MLLNTSIDSIDGVKHSYMKKKIYNK